MRDIKFRGERADGKWVYGYLVKDDCEYLIGADVDSMFDIIPKTVGQFTGLTDKNYKEVYEGDIVKAHYFHEGSAGKDLGVTECETEIVGFIGIDELGIYIAYDDNNDGEPECHYLLDLYGLWGVEQEEIEVLGNIHDNPELVEG